jgi:hypothetical protein
MLPHTAIHTHTHTHTQVNLKALQKEHAAMKAALSKQDKARLDKEKKEAAGSPRTRGGREGGREAGRQGGREGGREGEREGERERERERERAGERD